jgi:hypothetical protein
MTLGRGIEMATTLLSPQRPQALALQPHAVRWLWQCATRINWPSFPSSPPYPPKLLAPRPAGKPGQGGGQSDRFGRWVDEGVLERPVFRGWFAVCHYHYLAFSKAKLGFLSFLHPRIWSEFPRFFLFYPQVPFLRFGAALFFFLSFFKKRKRERESLKEQRIQVIPIPRKWSKYLQVVFYDFWLYVGFMLKNCAACGRAFEHPCGLAACLPKKQAVDSEMPIYPPRSPKND